MRYIVQYDTYVHDYIARLKNDPEEAIICVKTKNILKDANGNAYFYLPNVYDDIRGAVNGFSNRIADAVRTVRENIGDEIIGDELYPNVIRYVDRTIGKAAKAKTIKKYEGKESCYAVLGKYKYLSGKAAFQNYIFEDMNVDGIISLSHKALFSTENDANKFIDKVNKCAREYAEKYAACFPEDNMPGDIEKAKEILHNIPVAVYRIMEPKFSCSSREYQLQAVQYMKEYDLYSPFDIEKHKNRYINYLEVVITNEGNIKYAVPSHLEKMIEIISRSKGITKEEYVESISYEKYADSEYICKESECVCLWNNRYIGNPNSKQINAMKTLKLAGLYKGIIPKTK